MILQFTEHRKYYTARGTDGLTDLL